MLRCMFVEREGDDMVEEYRYTASIAIDSTVYDVDVNKSIFDDARRIWMFGKLIYSAFPQDFINHDRSLPMVIDTEPSAQSADV